MEQVGVDRRKQVRPCVASPPICGNPPISSRTFCAPAPQTRSASGHPPRSISLTPTCALRHRLHCGPQAVRCNGLPEKLLARFFPPQSRSRMEVVSMTLTTRNATQTALSFLLTFSALALAGCEGGGSGTTGVLRTNATLSALSVSAGTLSPSFTPGTTSYTVAVPFSTSVTVISPTAATSGASITVNGSTVASGAASSPISLSVGSNVIPIVVTNPDGLATRTYTVSIIRAAF